MEKIKIDKWKRVIQESKYFGCRGFGHITCNCRNVERRREKRSTLISSNKFEVFTSRVMNVGILSGGNVVATTHHSRTNDLTTSKALQWAIK